MYRKNPNLGYIINAMKRRKLQPTIVTGNKRPAEAPINQPLRKRISAKDLSDDSDDTIPDDPEPVVSDYESSRYSPVSNNEDLDAEMDTSDINNLGSPTGAGHTGAGETEEHTRVPRSAGGSGKGMSGSTGGGLRGTANLPRGIRQESMSCIRSYRKQYQFRIQNGVIEVGHLYNPNVVPTNKTEFGQVSPDNYGSCGTIRYPYHDIPVNMLGFYLTEEEMRALNFFSECRVKMARCDVYNKTGVLNFETASSISGIGNNNVGIYLNQISSDVGQKRTGTLPDIVPLIEDVIWGETFKVSKDPAEFTSANIAKLGARYVRRTLNNKFEYVTPMNQSVNNDFMQDTFSQNGRDIAHNVPGIVPYFNINPFIEHRINASMDEGLFTSWAYTPKDGLVAGNFGVGITKFHSGLGMNTKTRLPMLQIANVPGDKGKSSEPNCIYNAAGIHTDVPIDNDQTILALTPYARSANVLSMIDREELTGEKIPPLIIGIDPLISEIETSTNNKWEPVKCFVDLFIDVELTMECKYGFDYIDPSMPSIPANYKFPRYMLRGPDNTVMQANPNKTDLITSNILVANTKRQEFENIPMFSNTNNPLKRAKRSAKIENLTTGPPLTRAMARNAQSSYILQNHSEISSIKKIVEEKHPTAAKKRTNNL